MRSDRAGAGGSQRWEKVASGSQAGSKRQPSARETPGQRPARLVPIPRSLPVPTHQGCSRCRRRRSGPRSRKVSDRTGRATAGSSPPGSAAPRLCPRSSPAHPRSRCWARSSGLCPRGRRGGTGGRAGVSRGRGGDRAGAGDPAARGAEPGRGGLGDQVSLALFGPRKRSKAGSQKLLIRSVFGDSPQHPPASLQEGSPALSWQLLVCALHSAAHCPPLSADRPSSPALVAQTPSLALPRPPQGGPCTPPPSQATPRSSPPCPVPSLALLCFSSQWASLGPWPLLTCAD